MIEFLVILGALLGVAYISYEAGRRDARKITPTMVEEVTMVLVDRRSDPAPGVDWPIGQRWTINELRNRVRVALTVVLTNRL